MITGTEQFPDLSQMRQILETMPGLVLVVDSSCRILWANRSWEGRSGWPLDSARGRSWPELVQLQEDTARAALQAALARPEGWQGEAQLCDAGGTPYPVRLSLQPLPDATGAVHSFALFETEIPVRVEETETRCVQLANALEALPDGVIVWDNSNRLVLANSAYSRMYPVLADILVPGTLHDQFLTIGVERKAFPNAIGREESWLAEQRALFVKSNVDEVRLADGRWIRRLDLRTADGGCITVRIETTDRHRHVDALDSANRALAEARTTFNHIIESANIGTWDWHIDEGIQLTGGRYAQMLGYAPEEMGETLHSAFTDIVHPDDLAQLIATEDDDFAHPLDGKEKMREHFMRMRRKDGSWAWILSRSAVSERHPDGRRKRVVGIHLDVSRRKHLEDEVAASQAFLTGVMDASISAIIVTDNSGRITYANAEAAHILGYAPDALVGVNAAAWVPTEPDGSPMPHQQFPLRRALSTGETVRDIKLRVTRPDGSSRVLSANAAPHRDQLGEGAPGRVILSFVDITEDLEKAVRLEQAVEQAQAANRSKSNFLANMSHEIRTPLNGVLGMAELLDEMIVEPQKKTMIGTIRQSGELLLNVLNEVLDMSKIEAGKMTVEQIPFTPAEIVRQVEPVHSLHAQEKGLLLQFTTDPAAERARLGDPFRLQQILNNLLSNALKFTERGSVSVSLTAADDGPLRIEVTDTGIGMTPEQLGRIFDNFEQAEGGTTRRFGGTGLGMTIVRSLITLMGGEIHLASTPGEGTSVRLSLPLPLAESAPVPEHASSDMVALGALSGFRLLIADDSATNRIVLQEMLKKSGATIIAAANGAEAVSEWQRLLADGTPADLLLLDIAMPVMDGLDALAAIRAEGAPRVPAIAVTANAMAHQVADYLEAGFDTHVSKPFRRPDLLKAITALLRP